MKLNENTVIKGNSVVLVPYEECHVPKYHEWMKSEELQMLTASEPLTLEEEYEMQKTWRTDSDIKYFVGVRECTFIILDKNKFELTGSETDAMVGDTNIFLKGIDGVTVGEIEIMIAEDSARGKGFGKEAVTLMLRYGAENLSIDVFEAKIGLGNRISLSLFEKIGFEKIHENKVFNETTLQKKLTDSWFEWLRTQTENYNEEKRLQCKSQK